LLEPAGANISVRASARMRDPKLPPTAEVARDIARELMGTSFLPSSHAVDLVVGIDSSPSMRRHVTDGTIESLLNVFAGVASVVDPNGLLEAVLCGRSLTHLEPEPIATFAATTSTVLARQPLLTGCRSAGLGATADNALVYLVTDGMPDPTQPEHKSIHQVLLSADGVDWPGLVTDGVRATHVGIAAETDARWSSERCRPLVESLLKSYHDIQSVTS